ncbi:MAG: LUD domain-containing protein [Candidatus Aminicenantales bacterium]
MRRALKKKVRKALQDKNLQKALERASSHHFNTFRKTRNVIPWETYKERARAIREECAKKLPQLIQKFKKEAENAGASVYEAPTSREALSLIERILRSKKARLIVKSKSMVSEEIGLNDFLEKKGFRVVETDLGEWIIQVAKERPSHITAPALHKTKEEIASLLSRHLGTRVAPDSKEIVRVAREEMRKAFSEADVGISGANLAVAESGTLVIVSNEGNARLVTSLPPVHIALVTAEKFVESLEQAVSLIKALTIASSGMKLTAYVSFITGPSRTTDIEKELVIGAHGPRELHIIILDNGRLRISEDEELKKILYCLKCGGCMLLCPLFQAVGGHVFGGPVYPGGIGILLTAITQLPKESSGLLDFCADCRKCEEFCPVSIPTSQILLHLKNEKGPNSWEKALSSLFRNKNLSLTGAKILSLLQRPWRKDSHLNNLPFKWAKGKSIPALNPKSPASFESRDGQRVYLFEGCMVRYFFPEIRESVHLSLSQFGFQVVTPDDQHCCGTPSLHLGDKKDVVRLAEKNIKSFERENPHHILTICPTGNFMFREVYPRIDPGFSRWKDRIFDFTEFVSKKALFPGGKKSPPLKKVFYHYPCHIVNDPNLKDEPKKVLEALGFSPEFEEEPFTCCGFCGIFSLKYPEVSAHLWEKKKKKIEVKNPDFISTDCPGCLFQLRAGVKRKHRDLQILHTAELVARTIKESKQ